MIIMYQTDRGQCFWSPVISETDNTYFGWGIQLQGAIQTKYLFVGGIVVRKKRMFGRIFKDRIVLRFRK